MRFAERVKEKIGTNWDRDQTALSSTEISLMSRPPTMTQSSWPAEMCAEAATGYVTETVNMSPAKNAAALLRLAILNRHQEGA
jgi:hypothetical protein